MSRSAPIGEAGRPLRADARRNREALLDAASVVFTERGVDASLEDVARKAGVGIGTLYRHFPSREALVEAAYRHRVEQLCDVGSGLLHDNPADVALREWMRQFIGYVATKRGLASVLKLGGDDHSELFAYVRGRIRDTLSLMLAAGVEQGLMRADVDPDDLARALGGICMSGSAQPGWREQTDRLVTLLLDGLRYGVPASAHS